MNWIKNPELKKTMGGRIKAARGEKTRQELCDLLDEGDPGLYDRVTKWEIGENAIPVEAIPTLCEVLHCDVGFLFGEYAERTRQRADACECTGLTETAVAALDEPEIREAVETLLSSPKGRSCLRSILAYINVPAVQGVIAVTDTGGVVAPSVWDLGLAEADDVDIFKYISTEEALLANYTRVGQASKLAETAFLLDVEADLKSLRERDDERDNTYTWHRDEIKGIIREV